MPDLSIREFGDPVLRSPSRSVSGLDAGVPERIQQLIQQMYRVMDEAGGIGLAAPQIGVGLRVFTFSVQNQRGAVINPQLICTGEPSLVYYEDSDQILREGCLSVRQADVHAPVLRYPQVQLSGIDPSGAPLNITAQGLLAACFQHEVDHLDGLLFLDRLTGDEKKHAFKTLRTASAQRSSR